MFIPDYGTALIAGEVMFNCCASHNTEFTRWYLNCRTNYFVSKAPPALRFAVGRNFHQLGRKILNLGQTETCACLVYGRAVRAANCRTTLQSRAWRVIGRLACPIILDDCACNARQMPQFSSGGKSSRKRVPYIMALHPARGDIPGRHGVPSPSFHFAVRSCDNTKSPSLAIRSEHNCLT